ncbi:recombinase A, partial [Lyngbya sp. PCC 8106]
SSSVKKKFRGSGKQGESVLGYALEWDYSSSLVAPRTGRPTLNQLNEM